MSIQRRINKGWRPERLVASIRCRDRWGNHSGPNYEDKGKKDGHCNRTACQRALVGRLQFFMRGDFDPDGRLYYCEPCAIAFARVDIEMGRSSRCRPDEDNERAALGILAPKVQPLQTPSTTGAETKPVEGEK